MTAPEKTVAAAHAGFSKTRLAPTPSGYLHLGNIFSFVRTLALARKWGAKVLLRIDDMDQVRAAPHFIQDIFDTLHFLELPWDEGPINANDFKNHFAQHHRLDLYHDALQHLIDERQVFACTCTRTEILKKSPGGSYPGTCREKGLPLSTPNSALRLKTPDAAMLTIRTLSGVQTVGGIPAAMRDFVVRKKDGAPAYQLCSVVDDLYFGIDLIVRGADLWPSTLAQLYLSTVMPVNNFGNITFLHHGLVVDEEGKKMSKSAGATSVYQLRKWGKTKGDVFTAIGSMLGIEEPLPGWQTLAAAMERIPSLAQTHFTE